MPFSLLPAGLEADLDDFPTLSSAVDGLEVSFVPDVQQEARGEGARAGAPSRPALVVPRADRGRWRYRGSRPDRVVDEGHLRARLVPRRAPPAVRRPGRLCARAGRATARPGRGRTPGGRNAPAPGDHRQAVARLHADRCHRHMPRARARRGRGRGRVRRVGATGRGGRRHRVEQGTPRRNSSAGGGSARCGRAVREGDRGR